jgi:hypothetical protein
MNNSGHKMSTTTKELHNSFFLEINFAQLIEASASLEEEYNQIHRFEKISRLMYCFIIEGEGQITRDFCFTAAQLFLKIY